MFLTFRRQLFLLSLSVLWLSACGSSSNNPEPQGYENAILVLNEGAFGKNNASLDALNANDYTLRENDIFQKANSRTVGDVLQSAMTHNGFTYLISNNTATLEVVKTSDFKTITSIKLPVENPRYIKRIGLDKAYISTWSDFAGTKAPKVLVLDLNTNSIIKQMDVGMGAEYIETLGNRAFVSNSFEKSISVYDTDRDSRSVSISTAPHSPQQMVIDANSKIWALAFSYDSTFNSPVGSLYQINQRNSRIERIVGLAAGDGKSIRGRLAIDKAANNLYFLFSDGLYRMNTKDVIVTKVVEGNFYGLAYDAKNKNILLGKADFMNPSNNKVLVYDKTGKLIKELPVGIGPNGFVLPN